MSNSVVFYPMSEKPAHDDSDHSFSKTVIIFGEKLTFIDLGFYDFEEQQWSHFGKNEYLLKCWCYIPDPRQVVNDEEMIPVKPIGFKKKIF